MAANQKACAWLLLALTVLAALLAVALGSKSPNPCDTAPLPTGCIAKSSKQNFPCNFPGYYYFKYAQNLPSLSPWLVLPA